MRHIQGLASYLSAVSLHCMNHSLVLSESGFFAACNRNCLMLTERRIIARQLWELLGGQVSQAWRMAEAEALQHGRSAATAATLRPDSHLPLSLNGWLARRRAQAGSGPQRGPGMQCWLLFGISSGMWTLLSYWGNFQIWESDLVTDICSNLLPIYFLGW